MPWSKQAKDRVVELVEISVMGQERTEGQKGWFVAEPHLQAFLEGLAADITGKRGVIFLDRKKFACADDIARLLVSHCRRERYLGLQSRAEALLARMALAEVPQMAVAAVTDAWKFSAKEVRTQVYWTVTKIKGYFINPEKLEKFQKHIMGTLEGANPEVLFEVRDEMLMDFVCALASRHASEQEAAAAIAARYDKRWSACSSP